MDDVFTIMAGYIMFTSNITNEKVYNRLEELGLTFRKNKGICDIQLALAKARNPKNGRCKTEFELDMFSLYLKKDVLKIKR